MTEAYAHVDVIAALNWFQLFCFLWNNSVLQGISIMVVAGAVADWCVFVPCVIVLRATDPRYVHTCT